MEEMGERAGNLFSFDFVCAKKGGKREMINSVCISLVTTLVEV